MAETGLIAGGQIVQFVEHLTGDSGGRGSNPGLVLSFFSLPVTHIYHTILLHVNQHFI